MPQKLAKERRFSWPVRVSRPDAGDWQTFEFTAHFLAMSRKELDRIAANEVAIEEVLRAHLVGWESVQDAQGQPLAAALEDIDVLRALIGALSESASEDHARKNFKPPLAH